MALQDKNKVIGMLGDGSWATALIKLLYENSNKVKWWVRLKENVNHIKQFGVNPDYLSGVNLPKRFVKPSWNVKKIVKDADIVFICIPAAYAKVALDKLDKDAFKGKKVISAVKGMIPDEHLLITDYLNKHFDVPYTDMAVVSGPCHAEEVALGRQSYLTIGTENEDFSDEISSLLAGRYIKVSKLPDLTGIEYAAVMKNIMAIACGITNGLNYGDNFQAVLVSNAIQEMKNFLDVINPRDRDVSASAYLGDLLVTTYSSFSRNRTLGNMIGRGYTVKAALMEMRMVAEGYYAVKSINKIATENGINLPITLAVYNILYERISPAIEIELLKDKLS